MIRLHPRVNVGKSVGKTKSQKFFTHMALTDIQIKQAKPRDKQYRLTDQGGLYLRVYPNGAKYWQLRYRSPGTGKEKVLSLGTYPAISLTAARKKTLGAKLAISAGNDPGQQKQHEKLTRKLAAENTFEAVGEEWFAKQSTHWSETHKTRTLGILKNNLCKWLGQRPISEITPPELLAVLRKTEARGIHETARRALQTAGQVYRYAIATGRATDDPTRALKGALTTPKGKHFAAITDPGELGKLLVAIDNYQGGPEVKAALQLSPLFFCRPGELRQLEWSEVNWQEERIEIAAEKMKMRQPHIIPLCRQTLEILQNLEPITGSGRYLFPSARGGSRPLSENGVRTALRALGYTNEQVTPHGFRATARTLLDEVLGVRVDWIEHQLAHAVKDANGRAYNRTAHLEGRKEMMQEWADYLDNLKALHAS